MAVTWAKLAYEADVITKALLTTQGDIIYRNATVPARLAKGTAGHVLTMGADDPAWATPAAPAAHTLNSHVVPTGGVDFDLKEAIDLVVFTVANEAARDALSVAATEVGQLCFATTEKSLSICTVSVV